MQTRLLVVIVTVLLSVAVLSAAIGVFNGGQVVVESTISTVKVVDYYASHACYSVDCIR